jgi:hypothetical protein
VGKIVRFRPNSINYVGATHIYKIMDNLGQGADGVFKYGKGLGHGPSSARAARQVRRLNRKAGVDRYSYEVIHNFGGTGAAYRFETASIRKFGRHKPLGNKRYH